MAGRTKSAFLFAAVLFVRVNIAVAQSTLGELLDAGAQKLSVEEFKEQVVQRSIVGPTATGGSLELMYTGSGLIQGMGSYVPSVVTLAPISGEWAIGDSARICTSMRINGGLGGVGTMQGVMLPPRCQYWFKLGEYYFIADSDSERHSRVLRRSLKQ